MFNSQLTRHKNLDNANLKRHFFLVWTVSLIFKVTLKHWSLPEFYANQLYRYMKTFIMLWTKTISMENIGIVINGTMKYGDNVNQILYILEGSQRNHFNVWLFVCVYFLASLRPLALSAMLCVRCMLIGGYAYMNASEASSKTYNSRWVLLKCINIIPLTVSITCRQLDLYGNWSILDTNKSEIAYTWQNVI